MNTEARFLIDIVKQAEKIITPEFEVNAKDENGDLITNFDTEIETFIISEIKKHYPNFKIISEEFNSNEKLAENCFVIDPLDGTINFANGLPLWGIQVACVKNGQTCASVISLPKLNSFYYADETGSYLNDKKISVNKLPPKSCIYAVDGLDKMAGSVRMKRFSQHLRDIWSEAVTHAWVAQGSYGGVIFKNNCYWDYVPGQFLVKQAGGYIYNEDGVHVAANSKEFADLLISRAGNFENDIAYTSND